jgi:Fe-S oxidoreductase
MAPGVVNAATRSRLGGRLARWAAGVDQRRPLPAFAPRTFRQQWTESPGPGTPVVLWVDTFTDHFSPAVGLAAARVLEDAGYRVVVPPASTCCALTWITTGQLDAARRILGRTVRTLDKAAEAGVPVVGLEPSCTAVLRGDAVELLGGVGGGAAAERVARGTRTLAELLEATPGWEPPSLADVTAVAQPHCHHHAVLGWGPDERLLQRAGAQVNRLGGCCGLAGNWGVERGHHDVSVAIAGQQLLPAVREVPAAGTVLAAGVSCRTHPVQLTGRSGRHLAELLADRLP